MRKTFISQNIGKETSPHFIQIFITEGGIWEDPHPFETVESYASSSSGHLPGEVMYFRVWPVIDPDYLELRYIGGDEGIFSWETIDDGKSIINAGSTLYRSGAVHEPFYCNFNIYLPVSDPTEQTVDLGVFIGGESGEFINLGTLRIIHA